MISIRSFKTSVVENPSLLKKKTKCSKIAKVKKESIKAVCSGIKFLNLLIIPVFIPNFSRDIDKPKDLKIS